jgi:hypothetical protein
MKQKIQILKESGEREAYSREKLIRSLMSSGACEADVFSIANELEGWIYDGITSKKLYSRAFSLLRKRQLGTAAKYKLKKAMMELGPTGYPFEFFMGEVFKRMGFQVEVGKVLQGHCVTHEVDVIATRGPAAHREQHFVECKYYQRTGKNANVQVPLYIRSRVDDLIKFREDMPEFEGFTFHGWVATNTRFTADAITFGECTGLHLISWDYPKGKCLKDFIDREHIFPITVLTKLLLAEKQQLMEMGLVICQQLLDNPQALENIVTDVKRRRKLMEEINFLC